MKEVQKFRVCSVQKFHRASLCTKQSKAVSSGSNPPRACGLATFHSKSKISPVSDPVLLSSGLHSVLHMFCFNYDMTQQHDVSVCVLLITYLLT